MADYVISTKFDLSSEKALSDLDKLERKLNDIESTINRMSTRPLLLAGGSSGGGRIPPSLPFAGSGGGFDDVINNRLKMLSTPKESGLIPYNGGGNGGNGGGGKFSSFDIIDDANNKFSKLGKSTEVLEGQLAASQNSFSDLYVSTSLLKKGFFEVVDITSKLYGALKITEAFFVGMADSQQKLQNGITSLNAVLFEDQLRKGTTSMSELSNVSKSLMVDFKNIGNQFGISSKDVAKTYETMSLAVGKLTGASVNQILDFSTKVTRAMPLMTLTTRGQTLMREIPALLAGHATGIMPLVYRDIQPLLGGASAADINKMPIEKRFNVLNEAMDRLGVNTVKNTNTITGQWTIFMNNIRQMSFDIFGDVQKKIVGIMAKINEYMDSSAATTRLFEFKVALTNINDIVKTSVDKILFNFGLVSSAAPTMSERLDGIAKGLINVTDKAAGFINILGNIGAAMAWMEGNPLGKFLGVDKESFMKKYSNESDFNAAKGPFEESGWFDEDSKVNQLRNTKGQPVSNLNVTNNNQITVNLESDLPPDLIADSVAEAMRRAAMIPTSSSRGINVHAMAR